MVCGWGLKIDLSSLALVAVLLLAIPEEFCAMGGDSQTAASFGPLSPFVAAGVLCSISVLCKCLIRFRSSYSVKERMEEDDAT